VIPSVVMKSFEAIVAYESTPPLLRCKNKIKTTVS
jgi:hypothetical protein